MEKILTATWSDLKLMQRMACVRQPAKDSRLHRLSSIRSFVDTSKKRCWLQSALPEVFTLFKGGFNIKARFMFHTLYKDNSYMLAKIWGEGGLIWLIYLVSGVTKVYKMASKLTRFDALLDVGFMIPPPHGHTVCGVTDVNKISLHFRSRIK